MSLRVDDKLLQNLPGNLDFAVRATDLFLDARWSIAVASPAGHRLRLPIWRGTVARKEVRP